MDKKNTIIGVLLGVAALASLYVSTKYAPKRPTPDEERRLTAEHVAASGPAAVTSGESGAAFAAATGDHAGAAITTLENGFVQVRFTNFGGAIRDVALKKYKAALHDSSPFVFNELHADPMLALVDLPGFDRSTPFELVSKTATEIVYRAILDHKLEVTRRYVLSPDAGDKTDPYQIRAETTFHNLAAQASGPMPVSMAVGTAAPVSLLDNGLLLTTGTSDGKSQTFIRRSKLEASNGFLGMSAHGAIPALQNPGPVVWASVGNQFFTAILTPDQPGSSLTTRRVKLLLALPDADLTAYGITDSAQFDLPALAPDAKATVGANLYVGPKEYRRLANGDVFKADQDKVMQFGTFKFFSQILLTLMTWIHSFVPNWGLAIILTTLTLKTLFVPLTLASARSARRMQKIQPELKAINEKYKDNPQKKNTATMELFKAHKVNPAGGCLPILLTLPFFFGFFAMLQSTAELRFASFLWAHDLSAPDTVGYIFGFPINVLPILLGITSFVQMRLTPQPTVDNAQAKMMMFTPVIFLVFCYRYSCALSLYSTVNGLFTIAQQLIINRARDTGDPADAAAARTGGSGRPVKNVTPGRKR